MKGWPLSRGAKVPINHSAINDEVAAVAPKILQIIASRGAIAAGDAFERKLYVGASTNEKAAALPAINADVAGFYCALVIFQNTGL